MKKDIKFFIGLACDVAKLLWLILKITNELMQLVSSAGIYRWHKWQKSIDIAAALNSLMGRGSTFMYKPNGTKLRAAN